jgi:cytochrome c-type biogenesis protein
VEAQNHVNARPAAISGRPKESSSSLFITGLNREWRPRGLLERSGRSRPVVAGAAFALTWTPCLGPTLGAILGLAT